jgi:hypothetical protein
MRMTAKPATMQRKRASTGPSIVRLVVTNWILGAVAGILCAGLLLGLDLGGLRGLMFRESTTAMAGVALLFGGFAVTFGSAVCGSAIMSLGARDETGAGTPAVGEPVLARVPALLRRRRRPG